MHKESCVSMQANKEAKLVQAPTDLSAVNLFKELVSVIEWRRLAIGLNLDSHEMDLILKNNPKGIKCKINMCLFSFRI